MKTTRKVATLAATLITFGSLAGGASGALIFNFQEVGGNVVMTSSGTIDTSGLVATTFSSWGGTGVQSSSPDIMGGNSVGTSIDTSFAFNTGTDFSAWQTGNPWNSSFFSFDSITGTRAFATYTRDGSGDLVPGLGVFSGDLAGSVWTTDQQWTENGTTFAALGLNEGTYTVSDAVSGESITFQIGATSVPEPSSALLLGLGALAIVARRKRIA